jgi:hypothetical protein
LSIGRREGADRLTSGPLAQFCMVTTFYPPDAVGGDAVFVHQLPNMNWRGGRHHMEVVCCRELESHTGALVSRSVKIIAA